VDFSEQYDLVIVGAGTAGMPCAIEAVAAGLNVLVVEKETRIGGTLHVSLGQMSGAGTRLQRERGIADDAQAHLDDIMRINHGTGSAPSARSLSDGADLLGARGWAVGAEGGRAGVRGGDDPTGLAFAARPPRAAAAVG
jgi:2-polyprenyl-6-methoxyphenol hydroxylase-like FAD-dependent oxidoreductase